MMAQRMQEKREATGRWATGPGSSSSLGLGKLSQICAETQDVVMRAGRTVAKKSSFGTAIATFSFLASVACADAVTRKNQAQQQLVQLRGGRQMKLPPPLLSSAGMSKNDGVFSTDSSLHFTRAHVSSHEMRMSREVFHVISREI